MNAHPAVPRRFLSRQPVGVVCDDRAAVRHRVRAQLERVGIEIAGEADSFVPLLKLVLRTHPDLAVVTLPLAGTSGMTAVRALRAAAPRCDVVVLSAFGSLQVAGQEAGALAVLDEDDPRGLLDVLSALVRRSERDLPGAPPQAGPPSPETCVDTRTASAGSSTTKPRS